MPDSKMSSSEIRKEASEGFMEHYGFTIEEVSDFVDFLDNPNIKSLLEKFFETRMEQAMEKAFPGSPLKQEGYMNVFGTVNALRILKTDMDNIVQDYKSYKREVVNSE